MELFRGRHSILAVALAAIGIATLAFGFRGAAAQDGAAVNIVDFAFEPAAVEVPVGATVTWTNAGGAPHTVTANDGAFNSGQLQPGGNFSQTFDAAGSFPYFCEIHPQMTGTVTVTNGAAPEAVPAADDAASPAEDEAVGAAAQTTQVPRTGVGTAALEGIGGMALLATFVAAILGVAALLTYRRA